METSMTDPCPWPFCRSRENAALPVATPLQSLSSLGLAAILLCLLPIYGAKIYLGRAEQIQKGPG